MGIIKAPKSVRLVIGLLSAGQSDLDRVWPLLEARFGPIDTELHPFPFRWTNYYENELGNSPLREILAFENLIPRESLVDIKLWTNALEIEFSKNGLRPVNLDPGYMTLGQFFLATTKDQRQRVYVRDGIYVEPTLYFENGDWHPFAWTYRDWQSEEYLEFFRTARERLAYQHTKGFPWSKRTVLAKKLRSGDGPQTGPVPLKS
jgi:hypothetical protein